MFQLVSQTHVQSIFYELSWAKSVLAVFSKCSIRRNVKNFQTNLCLRRISAWSLLVSHSTLHWARHRPEVFWMSRGNPHLGEILNQENWRRLNSLHANTLQFKIKSSLYLLTWVWFSLCCYCAFGKLFKKIMFTLQYFQQSKKFLKLYFNRFKNRRITLRCTLFAYYTNENSWKTFYL